MTDAKKPMAEANCLSSMLNTLSMRSGVRSRLMSWRWSIPATQCITDHDSP